MVSGVLQSHKVIMVLRCRLPTIHYQHKLQHTGRADMHRVGYQKASVSVLKLVVKATNHRATEVHQNIR